MHINQQIDKYTVIAIVGEGGMGIVGKVRDHQGQIYALKQLKLNPAKQVELLTRFHREQAIQRQLHHPNLLPLIDSGEANNQPYFVMTFVEGESLKKRLKRTQLSNEQILAIIRDIGSALAYTHQQNILHRDIKPGNILLHPAGRAYLTDFGIATDPNPNVSQFTLTVNVSGLGTPDYMAPEVLRGQRATVAADVYAFAVTIYEVLTQRRYASVQQQGISPWQHLPVPISNVLRRATDISPARRYQAIASFTADCLKALSQTQSLVPTSAIIHDGNTITPVISTSTPISTQTDSHQIPTWVLSSGIVLLAVFFLSGLLFMIAQMNTVSVPATPRIAPTNVTLTSQLTTPEQHNTTLPNPLVSTLTPFFTATPSITSAPIDLAPWGSGTLVIHTAPLGTMRDNAGTLNVQGSVVLTGSYRRSGNTYEWFASTADGFNGWIRQDEWVSMQTIPNAPQLAQWSANNLLVTTENTMLRSNPSLSAIPLESLSANIQLIATGDYAYDPVTEMYWWRVQRNQTVGWILQTDLTIP